MRHYTKEDIFIIYILYSNEVYFFLVCLQGLRMPEPVSAKPVPKLRAKSATKASGRPRPKTIHVDQDADVNTALQSRGPRGSISNISGMIDGANFDLSSLKLCMLILWVFI